MVRIIPNRLKPGFSNSSAANSTANSRSASPMRSKGDSASPEGLKESGLVVHIAILKARDLAAKDRGGTSDPVSVHEMRSA